MVVLIWPGDLMLRKIFDLRKFFAVPKNFLKSKILCIYRSINGKANKAAAFITKFSDMLTLSQPEGADNTDTLALPCLKTSVITRLIY